MSERITEAVNAAFESVVTAFNEAVITRVTSELNGLLASLSTETGNEWLGKCWVMELVRNRASDADTGTFPWLWEEATRPDLISSCVQRCWADHYYGSRGLAKGAEKLRFIYSDTPQRWITIMTTQNRYVNHPDGSIPTGEFKGKHIPPEIDPLYLWAEYYKDGEWCFLVPRVNGSNVTMKEGRIERVSGVIGYLPSHYKGNHKPEDLRR